AHRPYPGGRYAGATRAWHRRDPLFVPSRVHGSPRLHGLGPSRGQAGRPGHRRVGMDPPVFDEGLGNHMARIGFIGLGIMGKPMALNLLKGGHTLFLYSLDGIAPELTAAGGTACASSADVA